MLNKSEQSKHIILFGAFAAFLAKFDAADAGWVAINCYMNSAKGEFIQTGLHLK